jgi:bla regulator protein blaR1
MQTLLHHNRAEAQEVHSMKTTIACAALLCIPTLFGQSTPRPLTFEVASIKPSDPDARGRMLSLQPGGGLRVTGWTLKGLITFAYDVRDFQVSGGPGWIDSTRYDIQAKAERSGDSEASSDPRSMTESQLKTNADQTRQRLQRLLAERFQLAIHRETREAPVYALLIGKNGPKLKEAKQADAPNPADVARMDPGQVKGGGEVGAGPVGRVMGGGPGPAGPMMRGGRGPMGRMMMGIGQLNGEGVTLEFLVQALSNQLGRPVLDKTGLTGHYDFKLQWTPGPGEGPNFGPPGPDAPPPPDPNGPSIFTAVQEQLGLRLESTKGPVEIIVVDRAEKASEN